MTTVGNSAHLTGTVSSLRPSIFEILSHQEFAKALKPAVFHVVKIFASYKPESRFVIAYRYFDEVYLAIDALVQWYYVLTRGIEKEIIRINVFINCATFSEAFYGLERTLISSSQKLSRIRLSYFLTTLLPYVSEKIKRYVREQREENMNNEQVHSDDLKSVVKQLVLRYFSYCEALLKSLNMFYLLAYTFDRSDHPSLIFKLCDMTLGYTSEGRNKLVETWKAELWNPINWRDPKKIPKLILRSLGESVFLVVEIGTFFFQFLEWWNNDEKRARITTVTSALVPSPLRAGHEERIQNIVKMNPNDLNKCPVCRKEIKNPTVVSVSGIAYCYTCIFSALKREGKCPLTNLPCNFGHLIRIFV